MKKIHKAIALRLNGRADLLGDGRFLSLAEVVQTLAQRQDQFRQLYDHYAAWAGGRGLPVLDGENGCDRLVGITQAVLSQVYTVLAYLSLVAVLVLREHANLWGLVRLR